MRKLAATVFFDSFILLLLGLVIVMSASSTYSDIKFDSLFHLFNWHLLKVLLGIVCIIIFSAIPYRFYKEYSKAAMLAVTVLLIYTLFGATEINGAGRWISIGPITFQPSDIARLVIIIHLAGMIEDKKEFIGNFKFGFMYMFFWAILISSLVFIQPNISNGVIIIIISLAMLFVGGAKLRHIFSTVIFSIIGGGAVAMLFAHSRSRILTFIHHLMYGGDINLQVKQAILGLGSGHIWGVGLGHSMQSNLFLPEAYGDFIFAILGEEMGFIGSVIVISCYMILLLAGILIAKKTKDTYGQMLAFGITFSIVTNAFINIAVSTGIVPTTGLPLPFISYGGTSLVFICISIGILINIALSNSSLKNTKLKDLTAKAEV